MSEAQIDFSPESLDAASPLLFAINQFQYGEQAQQLMKAKRLENQLNAIKAKYLPSQEKSQFENNTLKNALLRQKISHFNDPSASDYQIVPTKNGFVRVDKRTGNMSPILDENGKPVMEVPKSGWSFSTTPNGGVQVTMGQPGGSSVGFNPTTRGQRSLKGSQYFQKNADGTLTFRSSPTDSSQTAQQKRQSSAAESDVYIPEINKGLKTYWGMTGGPKVFAEGLLSHIPFLENVFKKQLIDYETARKLESEAAANSLRQSGATTVGDTGIQHRQDQMFSNQPWSFWDFSVPENIKSQSLENVHKINKKAVDRASEQQYSNYPYQSKKPLGPFAGGNEKKSQTNKKIDPIQAEIEKRKKAGKWSL